MTSIGARPIRGIPAAPGVAHGPYVRFAPVPLTHDGRAADPQIEAMRLTAASEAVAKSRERDADELRRSGHPSEARIFEAHAEMARDPALLEDAIARINSSRATASSAIAAAATAVADQLRALGDETLAGRASDVLDVGDRIARQVAGLPAATIDLVAPCIVIANDLPPSLTATLPRERLLAIVLEGSSPTAHAAILARAYAIPAVVGAAGILAALDAAGPEVSVMIDGSTGSVIIAPDASDLADLERRESRARNDRVRDAADAALPCETRDGTTVTLLANIGGPRESEAARAIGAEGVGLFRTEFLFLERATPPSEDEQVEAYAAVVAAFAPRPVTIRLLDVGGDKPIPYLPIGTEANPFLGVRALRLARERPEIFVTQLRACYRAAAGGDLKVMAPMIADADDAGTLAALAARARAELTTEHRAFGEIALGVMLEIPSAILVADTYFPDIAFASLGTNDLLQYTLAADRGNAKVGRYHDALHPALLRLVQTAVVAAERAGIGLSVCGEMAADPEAALALVGLGLRSLSMTPSSIPAVRRAIRSVSAADLKTVAVAALADRSAADARARFAHLAREAS